MILLLKFSIFICLLTTVINGECPVAKNSEVVFDCLGHITKGLYGAAIQDLNILCSTARNIANCTQQQLGDCIGAEFGRAALNEIMNLAEHCCPYRNNSKCSIRDELIKEQRCFAIDSFVILTNGKQKSIGELQSGDKILAYNDKTKKIISTNVLTMLDNQPNQFALFKQITTISGQQLSLTSSHLIPIDNHNYIMAKNLRIGMNIYVRNSNGLLTIETISNINDIIKLGYIAPLTEEGTLIVNNIAASCYATINNHYLAHTILAPMRWWYNLFEKSKTSNEIIGIHWFPKMIYDITSFFMPSIFA